MSLMPRRQAIAHRQLPKKFPQTCASVGLHKRSPSGIFSQNLRSVHKTPPTFPLNK
ncbi:hypothetical protein [Phormidium sp. CCY1219]|uniref:hypothetical protein n=1 Tax=Phormidium sp. CCY1219 TaxID=2886104 RepID=UPI002D1F1C7E|nr:hypothetical protein [Phormidium sp. CCY1219]MEB3831457.1 hypothetical protein [Phormidium sp. CCY1219]